MRYDETDKKMKAIFKSEISVPAMITDTVRNLNYPAETQKRSIPKMKKVFAAIAVAATLVLGVTVVSASGILDRLLFQDEPAIQKALEYEYVQNIEMDYIKSKGIRSKAVSLVMDSGNIAIVFEHQLDHKMDSFDDIVLQNFCMKDEQGNILIEDGNLKSLTSSMHSTVASEDSKTIQHAIFLESSTGSFPVNTKLDISFTGIKFFHVGRNQEVKSFDSQWSYSLDISDQFQSSQPISYQVTGGQKEVVIKNAVLSAAGMNVEFEFAYPTDAMSLDMVIMDEQGKKYETTGWNAEDESSKPKIKTNFKITSFEAKSRYQLILKDRNAKKEFIFELIPA